VAAFVPAVDEGADRVDQVADRGEAAAADGLARRWFTKVVEPRHVLCGLARVERHPHQREPGLGDRILTDDIACGVCESKRIQNTHLGKPGMGVRWFVIKEYTQAHRHVESFQFIPVIEPVCRLKQQSHLRLDRGFSLCRRPGNLHEVRVRPVKDIQADVPGRLHPATRALKNALPSDKGMTRAEWASSRSQPTPAPTDDSPNPGGAGPRKQTGAISHYEMRG
jgi:hypothetical protein